MANRQLLVINSQKVQNGRVNVVNLRGLLRILWLESPLIAFPKRSSFDPATT